MSARLGFLGGLLTLTALDAVLTSAGGTGRVTGAFAGVVSVINHITDPTVPAIPDLRPTSAQTSTANSGTTPPRTTRRHLSTV